MRIKSKEELARCDNGDWSSRLVLADFHIHPLLEDFCEGQQIPAFPFSFTFIDYPRSLAD